MNYNTYIIAEIGINHEGDFNLCKEMIYAAKEAGVKAVKLQTINPDKSYAKDTESYKVFSKAKLTNSETEELFSLSKNLDLDIFTTVADIETSDWIKSLKPAAWKISSITSGKWKNVGPRSYVKPSFSTNLVLPPTLDSFSITVTSTPE